MKDITKAVEKYRALILEAERYIWNHPETGYREYKTTAYLAAQFEKLGYTLTMADGITGFYTDIDTGRPGPFVMILGELDAVLCPTHPEADPETGAVHACGHNAQCAALLGIAAALREKEVLSKLCGRIKLCAVPAEEMLEIEYRTALKNEGKIKYLGGKSEFLHRGYFDGVELAFMVHTDGSYNVIGGSVGLIPKRIIYKGRASHAGGAPWDGCNALYAANCGLNAINALRETFRESDILRVHPIITHGGDMVSAIPETVTMESYVRGKSLNAIQKTNEKINRALCGAALSLGANIEIIDTPGYAPLVNCPDLITLCAEAAELAVPEENFRISEHMTSSSTDMGDLCSVMPVVHPYARGCRGTDHGNDYEIYDPEAACVKNAKWQLAMLLLLLRKGGKRAREIIDRYEAPFASAADFLAYQDSLNDAGERIIYHEDSTATVRIGGKA